MRVYIQLGLLAVRGKANGGQDPPPPSKALKILTPNPCVCLLTPLLNIYIPIQTASGENHITPLCFTLACRQAARLLHREREKSPGASIAINQMSQTAVNSVWLIWVEVLSPRGANRTWLHVPPTFCLLVKAPRNRKQLRAEHCFVSRDRGRFLQMHPGAHKCSTNALYFQ